jgi:tetraacyldisaccharide 4'-kinase
MSAPYRQLASRIEGMWWGKSRAPLLLRLASRIYAGLAAHDQRRRLARQQMSPLPLISVGNITAGGSGKTPFVIWLAGELKAKGYRPVILCRGDGGTLSSPTLITPTMPAAIVGDEARLLADETGCPVIAGHDRVAAAGMAADHGNIIVLDDGFQYRQLGHTCDIVLVPAAGLGNGALIPAGPMREPAASLARADLVVRTGPDPLAPLALVQRPWRWQARIHHLEDAMRTGEPEPRHVAAVSAIARPSRFHDDLARHGCTVDAVRAFPDHHRYGHRDVAMLLALACPVATTAKDAVKLAPLWPRERPLWIARQQAEAEDGLLPAILQRLPGP